MIRGWLPAGGAARERAAERRRESLVVMAVVVSATLVALGGAGAAFVDLVAGGGAAGGLALAALVAGLVAGGGATLWRLPERPSRGAVLAAFAAGWLTLSVLAALPFWFTGVAGLGDGLVEAVSGVTTTGATVFRDPGLLPPGVLAWRAASQWIGGLVVLVSAAAVLPAIGAGAGLDPTRSRRSHSAAGVVGRARRALRRLLPVYGGLTGVAAVAFLLGGMSPFDAACHALSGASTGGFSTRAGSFSAWDSAALEWAGIGVMVLAGGSFMAYTRALRGRPGALLRSVEVRGYCGLLAGVGLAAVLWDAFGAQGAGLGITEARHAVFTAVSAVSTTGFWVTGAGGWMAPAQTLMLVAVVIGACSGSTGGGLKVARALVLVGTLGRYLRSQLHPRRVEPVRLGGEAVDEAAVRSVVAATVVWFLVAATALVAVSAFGPDLTTSLSGVVSALSNVGPALGGLAPPATLDAVPAASRAVLAVAMLLGRTEVLPLLVGLSVLVWRGRR